jgi:predicted small secreted protein
MKNMKNMKNIKSIKSIVSILTILAITCIMGCNTIAGIGKDVQSGGRKIEGAAR